MVKNKKGSKTGKRTATKKAGTTGKSKKHSYPKVNTVELKALTDIWQDFSKTLNKNLRDIYEDNQAEYKKLQTTWTDFSNRFNTQMTKNIQNGNKEYKELYNVWKNYTNKLTTRLTRIGNNGGIDYEMLVKNWENYTKKLDHEIFGNGSKGENITTILTAWDNVYKNMSHQMEEIFHGNTTVNYDLAETWSDFSDKMSTLMTELSSGSTDIKKLNKDWEKFSTEWNKGVNDFIKKYEWDFSKLQDNWVKNTELIGETLTDTYDILSESYGDIYQRYLERTMPYFKYAENYSQKRIKSMEKEIDDLKSRLKSLETDGRKR